MLRSLLPQNAKLVVAHVGRFSGAIILCVFYAIDSKLKVSENSQKHIPDRERARAQCRASCSRDGSACRSTSERGPFSTGHCLPITRSVWATPCPAARAATPGRSLGYKQN